MDETQKHGCKEEVGRASTNQYERKATSRPNTVRYGNGSGANIPPRKSNTRERPAEDEDGINVERSDGVSIGAASISVPA